jgi:hypothetical protein
MLLICNVDVRPSFDYDDEKPHCTTTPIGAGIQGGTDEDTFAWYKAQKAVPGADAVKFWERVARQNSVLYGAKLLDVRTLVRLAVRYMVVPASSASSERVWSAGTRTVTDGRQALEGDNVVTMVTLASNKSIAASLV